MRQNTICSKPLTFGQFIRPQIQPRPLPLWKSQRGNSCTRMRGCGEPLTSTKPIKLVAEVDPGPAKYVDGSRLEDRSNLRLNVYLFCSRFVRGRRMIAKGRVSQMRAFARSAVNQYCSIMVSVRPHNTGCLFPLRLLFDNDAASNPGSTRSVLGRRIR